MEKRKRREIRIDFCDAGELRDEVNHIASINFFFTIINVLVLARHK